MIPALMILIPLILIGAAIYQIGLYQGRKQTLAGNHLQKIRLTEHANLMHQASEAYMKGDPMLAYTLESAAARVMGDDE